MEVSHGSKAIGRPATSPTELRPATSPPQGLCRVDFELFASPKGHFWAGEAIHAPRHVALRSRFLMHRSSAGPQRVPLPMELVPVVQQVEHDNQGEACTARSRRLFKRAWIHVRCLHTTHFVGEKSTLALFSLELELGRQKVPIQLVSAQPVAKRPITSRIGAA